MNEEKDLRNRNESENLEESELEWKKQIWNLGLGMREKKKL